MSESGQRRRVVRVRANLGVVIARQDGIKQEARVLDVGVGGMHLECADTPPYGDALTVIVRLDDSSDWVLLPATVRWFTGRGFGVAFEALDDLQADVLCDFVDRAAAA